MIATASGPIMMLSTFLVIVIEDGRQTLPFHSVILACGVVLCLVGYILARIGLLVLIFYSFKGMPVDVYKTVEWSEYFPHLS